ncbi:co-chaperone YbbN [Parenemella sanctibonifatiensis]|uniref:Co-chaperone YbbN n=2 Tax=Parenemella sanctibonifatiensis TaxID=2016505 RepID=A0A255EJ12_9ACTN|nr:co-chaperone YbbN [Parenemella sanctibonifatiensis]
MRTSCQAGRLCKTGGMSAANFSRPGAIDLSSLKKKPEAPAPAGGRPKTSGGYVVDLTEANFDQIMQGSLQHLIVLEFYSPRAQGSEQQSAELQRLANAAEGRYLLGRVNADEQPRIVQALQVQGVPFVAAVLQGQLAPLFEGVQPTEQLAAVLDQVVQAAVASGITGRAEPVGGAVTDETDDDEQADPRYAAADEAMGEGDFARAEAEFDKLLAADMNDAHAKAGKAQAGLLARTTGVDVAAVVAAAQANPADVDAQLAAADALVVSGRAEEGFTLLIERIKVTAGDDRGKLRAHLLALFETSEAADPVVLRARRSLMSALY